MKDPESLIADYLDDALDEAGQTELSAWLKEDSAHMQCFTVAVRFDQQIRDAVHARESAKIEDYFTPPPAVRESAIPSSSHSFKPTSQFKHRLARAAVWLGAFTGFGHKAAAATTATTTTILMTKSATTAITAAILIAGGGSVYLIYQNNKKTSERITALRSEIDNKRQTPPFSDKSPASPKSTSGNLRSGLSATTQLARWRKLHEVGPANMAVAPTYMQDLNDLDAEDLKALLLEAEKLADLPPKLIIDLLLRLAEKSPPDATAIGVRLVNNAPKFNQSIANYVGKAFENWLAQDPAAAHAWYLRAVEAGELTPKIIPPDGMDQWAPDRHLAQIRFASLLQSNLPEAEAMMATMKAQDVAWGISRVKDPAIVAKFTRLLPPSQQTMAANPTATGLAFQDFSNAAEWIRSLEISDSARGDLFIDAMSAAQEGKKIDLAGIAEWVKTQPVSEDVLPDLLLRAATNASIVSFKGPQWESMGERTAWLRQNLPADQAEKTVGLLLGSLALDHMENGIKAYERELARSATPDPHLTAGFAEGLTTRGGTDDGIREATRIMETLPPGPLREESQAIIKKNRR
jgi:hypothetical protein